jgi:hypothetical protein
MSQAPAREMRMGPIGGRCLEFGERRRWYVVEERILVARLDLGSPSDGKATTRAPASGSFRCTPGPNKSAYVSSAPACGSPPARGIENTCRWCCGPTTSPFEAKDAGNGYLARLWTSSCRYHASVWDGARERSQRSNKRKLGARKPGGSLEYSVRKSTAEVGARHLLQGGSACVSASERTW